MGAKAAISIDYVTDGLVLLLDGINKGRTVGAWTDLVGGHVFEERVPGTVVFGTDYVEFTSDIQSYLRNSTFETPSINDGTIEVVCDAETNKNACIYYPSKSEKICLARYLQNGNIPSYIWLRGAGTQPIVYGNYGAISISADVKMVNGISASTGPSNNIGDTQDDVNLVGTRPTSSLTINSWKFVGKVYCIRIYNRHLTQAEALANYAIDQSRFSLFQN